MWSCLIKIETSYSLIYTGIKSNFQYVMSVDKYEGEIISKYTIYTILFS